MWEKKEEKQKEENGFFDNKVTSLAIDNTGEEPGRVEEPVASTVGETSGELGLREEEEETEKEK